MIWSAIGALVQAFFGALFAALRNRRLDNERSDLERSDATNEAAVETQQAITETADERSAIPDSPSDSDELSRVLRAERSAASRGGQGPRGKRPF